MKSRAIREFTECKESYAFPWRLRRLHLTIGGGIVRYRDEAGAVRGRQVHSLEETVLISLTFLSFYLDSQIDFHECGDDQANRHVNTYLRIDARFSMLLQQLLLSKLRLSEYIYFIRKPK